MPDLRETRQEPSQKGMRAGIPVFIRLDPSRPAVALYRKSFALVIGISNYTSWRVLTNAIRDAEEVALALDREGFEVRLEKDLTGDQLFQVFQEWFLTAGQEEDARLFVWFAGHGHTIERSVGVVSNAYIIGSDAPDPDAVAPSEKANASILFKRRSLPLSRFGEYMKEANARHILVIFDSCFSGTIFSAVRSRSPAISMYTSLPARQFITSGKAGQTVSDDGAFRRFFVAAITGEDPEADSNRDGYITASELGLFLQQKVTNLTRNRQTPDYGSLREEGFDRGDFVFAITPYIPSLRSIPEELPDEQPGPEERLWMLVEGMQSPELTKRYLETYPATPYRLAAERQLALLRNPQLKESYDSTLQIYYATDRKLMGAGFGEQRDLELRFGKAVVNIPKAHRLGKIELPMTFAVLGAKVYQQEIDTRRHFSVMSDETMTREALAPTIKRQRQTPRSALLFIHGYNSTFLEALYRSAQLVWDLNFTGVPFLYSWPSAARISQYLSDMETTAFSRDHLREFLEVVVGQCGFSRLHILAHGMGAQLLMPVLERISLEAKVESDWQFGEIILVAPDMDADLFDRLSTSVQRITRGITIYASANDKVLSTATTITGIPRAGEIRKDGPAISSVADVIDITERDGSLLGHSYFARETLVLEDIRNLIETSIRPPSRRSFNIRKVQGSKGPYWKSS
jgi:esterase/lipase superfamily enzyme